MADVDWSLILICSLVTWRVGRFIAEDALIDGTRSKVKGFLDQPRESHWRDVLADKVWTLLTCAWCLSIWVSAGTLLVSRLFWVDSIPAPVWTWLAVSALPLIPWNYVDGD
jgi:hypothetical protein